MEKNEFISKQALRSRYLGCRNSLSASERKEKSAAIWELLKKEAVFQKAQIVLVYMDYRSEVMTTALVEEILAAGQKRVFAPKVEGMDIQFYEVESMEDFTDGYQGIREPLQAQEKLFTQKMSKEADCLILVPGAVFDRERGRMRHLTIWGTGSATEKDFMTVICRHSLILPVYLRLLHVKSPEKFLWRNMIKGRI